MLKELDRWIAKKREESALLDRLEASFGNEAVGRWLSDWKKALQQTEQSLSNWRNSVPSSADSGLASHLRYARYQSDALFEQINRLFPGFDPHRQEPGLTGEGIWSDPAFHAAENQSGRVPIGGHVLPPLPYPHDALEPYIDGETMRLHHDIHHKSYVDGLNKAERMMEEARKKGNFDLLKHWEREAAFNGAGHYLHTIFWCVMSPDGGGKPDGELLKQIETDFGSFDKFKAHFSQAAEKVEGGGWAILVWSPRSRRLEILQAEKHQNLTQWDVVPLLVLDVWEHAYYLKYRNERARYVEAWWNVVNWPCVEQRFREASKLVWTPY